MNFQGNLDAKENLIFIFIVKLSPLEVTQQRLQGLMKKITNAWTNLPQREVKVEVYLLPIFIKIFQVDLNKKSISQRYNK